MSRSFIAAFLCSLLFSLSANVSASAWTDTGDLELRHHIQVLSQAGIIDTPINSWPIMWSNIDHALNTHAHSANKPLNQSQLWSLAYVNFALQRAKGHHSRAYLGLNQDASLFDGFGKQLHDQNQLSLQYTWMWDSFAARLSSQRNFDSDDGKQQNFDGSYVAALIGNWAFSLGAISRWWGPGWDNSLILGNNARPVPALSIQRNHSTAFETPLLSWLGPWQFNAFIGELEEKRHIGKAKLLGMRLSFRPTNKLEIGLSRTAQWGGEGRPQSFNSLWKVLIGQDNTGQNGITGDNEPSNQLAGFDASYQMSINTRIYGQLIGEDEAGFAPSRFIALFGAELLIQQPESQHRIYLEALDTTAGNISGNKRINYAYQHGTYRDGYRFHGDAIGASIDSDSQQLRLAWQAWQSSNQNLSASLSYLDLNQDKTGPVVFVSANKLWLAQVGIEKLFGNIRTGIKLQYLSDTLTAFNRDIEGLELGLSFEYRH